jgi:hypothetical protein
MWGKYYNFLHKTLWIATMFPRMSFFMFFLNYLCPFYWRKHCNFSHKTPWNVDCYSVFPRGFFCYDFFKNYLFFILFFQLQLQAKLNHVGKTL